MLLVLALGAAGCDIGRPPDFPNAVDSVAGALEDTGSSDDEAGAGDLEWQGHLSTFVDSIRSAESRRLADAGTPVRRHSVGRLVVTPAAGDPVVFDDEMTGGDLMRLHIFRGRIAGRFSVLEVIYYEGGQFLLVDERSGRQHPIDGVPKLSPDGTRFVTTSLDLVAGHQPNRIAIYRITDDGIAEEWAEQPRDWGPSHAEWIDDGTIRFRSNVINVADQPHTMTQSVAWADRLGQRWSLRR